MLSLAAGAARHRGVIDEMTGTGLHAVLAGSLSNWFHDPAGALPAESLFNSLSYQNTILIMFAARLSEDCVGEHLALADHLARVELDAYTLPD